MATSIDWGFILQQEGYWLTGYVPNVAGRSGAIHSGVTLLFGFDLGQQDQATIEALPISAALKARLLPFVGLRGASAVMALQNRFERALNTLAGLNGQPGRIGPTPARAVHGDRHGPVRNVALRERATQFTARDDVMPGLTLTQAEARELDPAVKALYTRSLAARFDRAARTHLFATLPAPVQTALLSLRWHTGSLWAHKPSTATRQAFDAAVRRDWLDVVDTLKCAARGDRVHGKRRLAEARLVAAAADVEWNRVGPKEQSWLDRRVDLGERLARTG